MSLSDSGSDGADDGEEVALSEEDAKRRMVERMSQMQETLAAKGVRLDWTVRATYAAGSPKAKERQKQLAYENLLACLAEASPDLEHEPDPEGALRYPWDGPLQLLVHRAYRERRKIKLMEPERDRHENLRIQPPLQDLISDILTSDGAIDLKRFRDALNSAGNDVTIKIEGACSDAVVTPGIWIEEGMRLELSNLKVVGSKRVVYEGDGTLLPPLIVAEDASAKLSRVKVDAGDERANPAYCANISESGRLHLVDCDLTSCHQEFAVNCARSSSIEFERSKVGGLCMAKGGACWIKDCVFTGVPEISATGIFSASPSRACVTGTTVSGFKHDGICLMGNKIPTPLTLFGNVVNGCGEYGLHVSECFGAKDRLLQENGVSNNGFGDFMQWTKKEVLTSEMESEYDPETSRMGLIRQQLEGKYAGGCIHLLIQDINLSKYGGHQPLKLLNAKGAVLGEGSVPLTIAAEQAVFVCGDAGICSLDSSGRLQGIRWSNGDFWQKGSASGSKVANKVLLKTAADLIGQRKKAGEARELEFGRRAGPSGRVPYERKVEEQQTRNGRNEGQSGSRRASSSAEHVQYSSEDASQMEPKAERQEQQVTECVVCLTNDAERPVNWIFESCGHRCLCKTCARKMRQHCLSSQVVCPKCRKVSRIVPMNSYGGRVYD